MNTTTNFIRYTLGIVAIALLASGCSNPFGGDDNDNSSSAIRVSIIDVAEGYETECNISPVDYPIILGDREVWDVTIRIDRQLYCGETDITLQPEDVSGGSAGIIDTDDIAKGYASSSLSSDDNTLDVTLAPGTFRIMVDGEPSEATITVAESSTRGTPPLPESEEQEDGQSGSPED